jgi:hypothetical protein
MYLSLFLWLNYVIFSFFPALHIFPALYILDRREWKLEIHVPKPLRFLLFFYLFMLAFLFIIFTFLYLSFLSAFPLFPVGFSPSFSHLFNFVFGSYRFQSLYTTPTYFRLKDFCHMIKLESEMWGLCCQPAFQKHNVMFSNELMCLFLSTTPVCRYRRARIHMLVLQQQ